MHLEGGFDTGTHDTMSSHLEQVYTVLIDTLTITSQVHGLSDDDPT